MPEPTLGLPRKGLGELGAMTDRLSQPPLNVSSLHEEFGLTLILDTQKRVVTVESQPSQACTYQEFPRGDWNHTHMPMVRGESRPPQASFLSLGRRSKRSYGRMTTRPPA
ncbi:hypothetical protein GCM10010341_60410 [Streptomyces noursei]|nr:hypothetical protein GCM10010341_60410 [Streptomyces noursei]